MLPWLKRPAAAAESLVDQANSLSDVVSVFKFENTASSYAGNKIKPQISQERRTANSPLRAKNKSSSAPQVRDSQTKVIKNGTNDDESWEEF